MSDSAFLPALQKASLPAVWAQGVKLARAGAVSVAERTASEIVGRVRVPGRALATTTLLYPDDLEWTCDCDAPSDPCPHAIALAIAVHQGSEESTPEGPQATLEYHLALEEFSLVVTRRIVQDGETLEVTGPLSSLVARGAAPIDVSQDDLAADRLLQSARRRLDATQVSRLFPLLKDARTHFNGRPVRILGEPLKPVGRVFDEGEDVVLELSADPRLTRVLAPGLAEAGEALASIGAADVGGLRFEHLPQRRRFARHELGKLVQKILPELTPKLEVQIDSERLPGTTRRLRPRLDFEVAHDGPALRVLPTLVYGDPPVARVDNGELVHLVGSVPRRSLDQEQALIHSLRAELNLMPGRHVRIEPAEATAFVSRLRAFEARSSAGRSSVDLVGALVPDVQIAARDLTARFVAETSEGPLTASAERVLAAWRAGLDIVALETGGWAKLPTEWLAQHAALLEGLLAARENQDRLPTAALPALGELCRALNQPQPVELQRLRPLFENFEHLETARLPGDLNATLRPYQCTGVNWLAFLRSVELGGVLADDMGLGKTLQTLCVLKGRSLVVCPKSVLFNWQAEAERFRPRLSVSVYHGSQRSLDPSADLTLTTYAVLRLDVDVLSRIAWQTVVLDEAQNIKNPRSQVAQAAFALSAAFPVALSGTPIENRLEELWSILHFTTRGLLGGLSHFEARFSDPIAKGDNRALSELKRRIAPFVLRRLKREVAADLPPRTDIVLPIELDEGERTLYDAVLAASRRELLAEFDGGRGVMAALEALMRLRQAACHSGLLPGQARNSSSKVEALLETLIPVVEEGHKAIVFSQWTSMLDRIEPHVAAAGISYTRLDGKTRDRSGVVGQFQDPTGPMVLLASLKAGGSGLNLTAADHVFIVDPWWNPAQEDQAADRAHRIGQTRQVMVYRLVAKDTVEEGILRLQERKRALGDAALGDGQAAGQLTRDDLLALLDG